MPLVGVNLMNAENALAKFIQIVSNEEYHKHYDRTLQVANDAYIFATGHNIDEKINSIRTRETLPQKKQRVSITKPLPPISVEMVKKYFRKVRKVDGVKSELRWENENKTAKQNLLNSLSSFYALQNVGEYIFDIAEDYTFIDPNAFLVIERMNVTDEAGRITAVQSYPVEYESKEVRHYEYSRGLLAWLLTEVQNTESDRGIKTNVSEFRMYGAGWTLHAVEYTKEKPSDPLYEMYAELSVQMNNAKKTRKFVYRLYQTGTIEVPAIRLGAYLDGRTKMETAVTPMEPVGPLLESLIGIGSLHDLTIFLHSIPRRRELVEVCDYRDDETGSQCDGGVIHGGATCPRCKGTGDKSITSEQDMIRITLPPNFTPEDIPDLSKMAHVEKADVDLLKWQQEKLDWLLKFIVYATMTRDAVTMAEVSRTATEAVLNNQDAYDKLHPYTELISQIYMLIARITVQYQDTYNDFVVNHRFPDDYQFETEKELLAKLKEARETHAPYEYISRINAQLVQRQTRSSEEAERANAWAKWKPWPDLTDEMIAIVIADREPQDYDRMLRENFFRIRTEIEQETGGMFYRMPYEGQKMLIETKIQELTASIQFRSMGAVDFPIDAVI